MTTPKAKLAGLALIAVLVLLPCTSTAQQKTEEPPAALEQSQGTAIKAPAPQSETLEPSAQQEPPAAQPPQQPVAPEHAKSLCDKPQTPEERDLCQQWRMADAAEKQAKWTKRQFWITVAEVLGLLAVVIFTALTAKAANRSAKAAQAAVKAAQRQADAAILVEAAKLVVDEAYLSPVGGGVIDKSGIPGDGYTPSVRIRNIGKTRAFILSTSLIMKASLLPPEQRYPIASQNRWMVAPGIQAGVIFDIDDESQTVSLTEEQIAEMGAGRLHLWLFGCIWFKDWFDISRQHEFLLRWKAAPDPGEPVYVKTGFIPHEIAT